METNKENHQISYRQWLQNEFISRCKKNPTYSIRAFANLFGMDSSTLSQILSGKRKASAKLVQKCCERLGVSPELKESYMASAKKSKDIPNHKGSDDRPPNPNYQQLALDTFAVISDWYHFAILELTFTSDFESSAAVIARRLGLQAEQVKIAIERLLRLGLLKKTASGSLIKAEVHITNFKDEITAPALMNLQRQVLEKALLSLETDSVAIRDMSSMTMAIDVEKIPEAKKLITKFRRELCEFLEEGHRKQVYHLGIQLYPITKVLKNKKTKIELTQEK